MDVAVRPTTVGVARNAGGSTSTSTSASSAHVLPLFPAASTTATHARSGPLTMDNRSFSANARVPTHVSRYSARLDGSAGTILGSATQSPCASPPYSDPLHVSG